MNLTLALWNTRGHKKGLADATRNVLHGLVDERAIDFVGLVEVLADGVPQIDRPGGTGQ